jgi:hypothetical protein
MTNDPKITPEEMERRRGHIRAAIANNRIEGIVPSAETLAICEAYIRGEIEGSDLMAELLKSKS